jgi:hypothetical protein
MQTNSCEKKHKEQEPYGTQTLPYIHANRDHEQNAVFDNAKPARLRMQGDIFFLPVEFFEGHGRSDFFSFVLEFNPITFLVQLLNLNHTLTIFDGFNYLWQSL